MEERPADGELSEGCRNTVVLIPAFNPDEKLLALLTELKGRFPRIVLVDDGSVQGCDIIAKASEMVEKVLVHPANRGKGAALKTGLNYIGECDTVTADADGQHTPDDITKVADALKVQRDGLVLGTRTFSGNVPLRSRFGNFWTRWFFFFMTGLNVRDTQTGLRGIPAPLVKRVVTIAGDRYEFEMAMLADAKHHKAKPLQVPISTVYIDSNSTSHFQPLADTIRIYRSLLQFCLSSVLGFLLDNAVYAALVAFLSGQGMPRKYYALLALCGARLVSSNFNYFYNRFVVFAAQSRRRGPHGSYFRYWALVLAIGAASYALTETFGMLLDVNGVAITVIKIFADAVLFFVGYFIQKRFVFTVK
jgi:glycosyltransferase involved in cell wall biosynthesis